MVRLTLATHNHHKVVEFRRLLAPFGLTVDALAAEVALPPEDGDSYGANALIKARAAALQLGRAVLADDSGIEAAALGGRPGVRSARYAGESAADEDNLHRLIAEVPAGGDLRYVCVVAFVDGHGERLFRGECVGRMQSVPRGTGGFGYDPVFAPAQHPGSTMAELAGEQKDAISHRANAVRGFARWYLESGPGSACSADGR